MLTKLVSMVDFVKTTQQQYLNGFKSLTDFNKYVSLYSEFLSQKLTLGMFVPVDHKGNVLEEPAQYIGALELAIGKDYDDALLYKEAKSKVLLGGKWKCYKDKIFGFITVSDDEFEINLDTLDCYQYIDGGNLNFKLSGHSLESIANTIKGLTLTETAIKQIYG